MRPVRATLNKTLTHNTNAVNPLKNSGYAVFVVYDNTLELANETAQKCIEQQIDYSV